MKCLSIQQPWNLLREFHRAKDHTAYVRDVAANLGVKRSDITNRIEALGLLIAGRDGRFRIVRRLNPKSECWWPVFFNMQIEEPGTETSWGASFVCRAFPTL